MADVWFWIAVGLVVWALLAALVAVVLGRGIRLADQRAADTGAELAPVPALLPARRHVPLPPVGVALAAIAVGLEGVGYVLRLTGATGPTARALSMDAPYSAPRLFVAGLFAVAAFAGFAAAGRIPGRRTWWAAVGLVAAVIAVIKTGSTVHSEGMARLAGALGEAQAVALSMVAAGGVVAALAVISRAERRDRRRILLCLTGYAVASVGLAAASDLASGRLHAALTFIEESGEALAGVAFLIAVLVGVAPRLVLPASWPLRREADAHTLEVASEPAGEIRRGPAL
ncbi:MULTISPECIES: hypothetical protein [unclassified Blastococcus]